MSHFNPPLMPREIPFTQFHLPNGRRSHTTILSGDEEWAAYEKIRGSGLRLTIEILTTGHVSMCIEDPDVGDFDQEVCPNDPQVPLAVSKMLLRFDPSKVEAWRLENA